MYDILYEHVKVEHCSFTIGPNGQFQMDNEYLTLLKSFLFHVWVLHCLNLKGHARGQDNHSLRVDWNMQSRCTSRPPAIGSWTKVYCINLKLSMQAYNGIIYHPQQDVFHSKNHQLQKKNLTNICIGQFCYILTSNFRP